MTRVAATLILARAGSAGLEVLMARRTGRATFASGLWVFPGGAVDDVDSSSLARELLGPRGADPNAALISAALRETAEEINAYVTTQPPDAHLRERLHHLHGRSLLSELAAAGLVFDTEHLAYWSNWITPRIRPKRFDTHFFVVEVDPAIRFEADGSEIVDVAWVTPGAALAGRRDDHRMMFPTIRNLVRLSELSTPAAAIAAARRSAVDPIEPAPILDGQGNITKLLIPGDEGYEELLDQQVPHRAPAS